MAGIRALAWIDATNATGRTLSDDSAMSVPIGFTFPFSADPFTDVYVGSNGLLGFGSAPTAYVNAPIPSAAAPSITRWSWVRL